MVKRLSPSLMFLSKTNMHRGEADKIRCMLGFEGVLQVDSNGKNGGLLLLWKD